jgi:arylformamidase
MRIYDISLTVTPELPVWPGDPQIVFESRSSIAAGDDANVTGLKMGVHTGTHVDAPHHFLEDDPRTVDLMSLKTLTGRTYVLHLPDQVSVISAEILTQVEIPPRTRRLLFRTRNSSYWATEAQNFREDFVAIDASGAQYLVDRGVKLVGVDYLSVAPFDAGKPTHEILLKAGMILLEGLDLSQVEQGRYALYCLPIKLGGVEGAPARAILIGP